MTNKIYKCRLCYTDDNINGGQTLEAFLYHLIKTHDAIKAKTMLETLEIFGVEVINDD